MKELEKNNILYLVKMGCDYEPDTYDMKGSDVGNYRIRGTFHDKNNDIIFIEFGSGCRYKNNKLINRTGLRIDHQFNTSIDWDENKSHIKIDYTELDSYNYTKSDILKYIKNKFGVCFNNLILIDTRLFDYDYTKIAGDEIKPDFNYIKPKNAEIVKH